MALIQKLLRRKERTQDAYSEAGARLTVKLVETLCLEGWRKGLPAYYTPREKDAINMQVSALRDMVGREGTDSVSVHPEAANAIQQVSIPIALADLANDGWRDSEELPINWKDLISTYLKAWAGSLSGELLLPMAHLLAKAAYIREAEQTLQVVLLYPNYVQSDLRDRDYSKRVRRLVEQANADIQQLHEEAMGELPRDRVRAVVNFVVRQCIERESQLLALDVNERSLTHKLAEYLQRAFPEWNVDCEYNRNHDDVKRLDIPTATVNSNDTNAQTVFPDIIVHKRDKPENFLVIEVKKTTNTAEADDYDLRKLRAFREQLGYEYAIFLKFRTGKDRPGLESCRWVED